MTCGQPFLEKHALKYHLTHQAYLQAKTAEMNLMTSPGLQTTLTFASGSACLGLNDLTKQYRSPVPFSGMDDPNGYNDSVISCTAISAIYNLYAQNSRSHESTQLMCSILGNYCTVHCAQSCLRLICCICMLGNILSIDHTMKMATKAEVVNKSCQHIKPFLAVFQVLDEELKILAWVCKC